MTLSRKIILATSLLLILSASILTYISYSALRDQTWTAITDSTVKYNRANAAGIDKWLQTKRLAVASMVNSIAGDFRHESVTPYLVQGEQGANFDLTYFGTEEGNMYRTTGYNSVEGYDPRQRGWYQQALAANDVVISAPFVAASTGKLSVTVAQKVVAQGETKGAVGASLGLDSINDDILEMEVPGDGFAMLVTAGGTIVSHADSRLRNTPLSGMDTTLQASDLGAGSREGLASIDFDGREYLVSALPIQNTDWYLVMAGDAGVLTAPLRRMTWFMVAVSAVIIVLSILMATPLIRFLLVNLLRVSTALEKISQGGGDLTQRIDSKSHDEVGQLADNFNSFVDHLRGIMLKVQEVSSDLSQQSLVASSAAEQRSQQARAQQDEVTLVATAVTEMAAATQEIASNAETTANTSLESVRIGEQGQQISETCEGSIERLAGEVDKATQVIAQLDEHSQQINSIVSTIMDIAEQTNLLALNAAIEAARAGEQGRGFAVVADEVRVLSQRTHASTEEISTMISSIQDTTGTAVNTMNSCHQLAQDSVANAVSATQSFRDIAESVRQISDMATQIATAAEEQTSVTDEINRNTETIRCVSEDFLSESEAAAQQANDLDNLSQQLTQQLSQFKLS